MGNNNSGIEVTHIRKEFQGRTVLSDINIKVGKGEIFGLLGPSGAGKTTLIKILTGQLSADAGEAVVMGRNVKKVDSSFYKNYGMVLDNTGLYHRLTCKDNLLLFAEIYGLKKTRAKEVLEQVGLVEAYKTPVHKLSKGMMQRLVLARAFMHEPKILFLDEPTSGLDPSTARDIRNLIQKQKEKGTTVFLTTHNMEEATELCKNIALLFEGKLVEYGEPDAICRKYNNNNSIKVLLKDGKSITLSNESTAAEEIYRYFKEEQVESIHSSEPNLESVFVQVTGRKWVEG